MKKMSKTTEKSPRPNFVGSPKSELQSSLLYAMRNIWIILNIPPVKSRRMFPILHPTVLFLLKIHIITSKQLLFSIFSYDQSMTTIKTQRIFFNQTLNIKKKPCHPSAVVRHFFTGAF